MCLLKDEKGTQPRILVKAFEDTWSWGTEAEMAYHELLVNVNGQIGDTIEGLRKFLNETPMMAYLVMMATRLVEMHRLLKDTGSLYLHCDPTASHYLKILLDAVFGVSEFRNEIIWSYQTGGVSKRWFGRKHDVILFYSKTNDYFIDLTRVKESRTDEVLRRIGTGNESATRASNLERFPFDVWNIQALNAMENERTGYPTQKPIALYKKIVEASSNKDDIVLDPFAGCGTTAIASEQLERQWIGIDLTYLAIGAVKLQIEKFCPQIRNEITIIGTPEDAKQALELATDHEGFEGWCIAHVLKFQSNAKKGADGGVDGRMKFPVGPIKGEESFGKAVAQVKGGRFKLGDIRDFRTAMDNENADIGVFIGIRELTPKMETEIARAGVYQLPYNNEPYPRLQYFQIQDYFDGKIPKLPSREKIVLAK